jgi:hypothetical protein
MKSTYVLVMALFPLIGILCFAAVGCPDAADQPRAASYSAPNPVTPASWTVTDWYINPANLANGSVSDSCASDTNSCQSATCVGGCSGSTCPSGQGACLTFGVVIQQRLGTPSPLLQQVTTFHKLSAQVTGTDLIYFTPRLGVQGQAIFLDTLMPIDGGVDAAIGTVTPKQVDAGSPSGGQLLQVAGLPGNTVANNFVCNLTRSSSCAFVDSIVDAGVAIMQQPLTAASYATPGSGHEDNTWATGDNVNVYTENQSNLKVWNPTGTDTNANDAGIISAGWVQFTHIIDPGGPTLPSTYPLVSANLNGIAGSQVDPAIYETSLSGANGVLNGNAVQSQALLVTGYAQWFGGGFAAGFQTFSGGLNITDDTIVHGSVTVASSSVNAFTAYHDGLMVVTGGGVVHTAGSGGTGTPYGPGGIDLLSGGTWVSGTNWNNFFVTGFLILGGSSTGCVMTGLDAGAVTCNIPINKTNLIAQHTLKSFNNGATFTDGTQ